MIKLRGFQFVTTLVTEFEKRESDDATKYFYSNPKAETIINESDIDNVFRYDVTIMSNIQKSLGKGSRWIIDSAIDHNIDISKYNPLADSSYIKLPNDLDHPKKV